MLNSWFSSKSSRHRKTPSNSAAASDHVHSDVSLVSQSTAGPVRTPANLTSSDVPLEEVHAHINDPSIYAPTSSLLQSTEKEVVTIRTSDVPPSPRPVEPAPEHPEGALFTPQDAILAQVFGKSAPPAVDAAQPIPPPSNAQPSVSLTTRTRDSAAPTPTPPPHAHARPGPVLTIYDPFSGVKLGEHTPIMPSTTTPGDASASASAPLPAAAQDDRRLWSSLERILELQAEIAAMHADMEGVGRAVGGNAHVGGVGVASMGAGEGGNRATRRRSRRGQTLPVGDEEPEEQETGGGAAGGAISEASTEHSDGEAEDEDDEDEDGVHGYGKRRRDEEFAKLAEQFTQRKAAIGGIMNKLDALSVALKTFHTLPPPLFDFATAPSRTDTMSSAPSNVSSPPPLPTHSWRPPSPFSSTSPSQTRSSITPPKMTHSPPVPPISTLAPPVNPGDLGGLPGLTPIVAPVLPQIALPTIIPGAPHVESPADMDHTQSVFRRVP